MSKAVNRWGAVFGPGTRVTWTTVGGATYEAAYVRLCKPDDFSRAYGRQAIVRLDGLSGPMTWSVGLDDLVEVK